MIVFEMAFIMLAIAAIAGPIVFFGLRRYFRWMANLAAQEDRRDREAMPRQ